MGSLRGEWLCWASRGPPGEATTTLHRMESTKIKTSLQKAEKLVAVEENGREKRKRREKEKRERDEEEKRKRGKRIRGKEIKRERWKQGKGDLHIVQCTMYFHPRPDQDPTSSFFNIGQVLSGIEKMSGSGQVRVG